MAIRWSGPLAPYGVMTGDRRMFTAGTIDSRSLPLPLAYQPQSSRGHGGSIVVGSIDHIDLDSNPIQASGTFLDPADEPAVRPAIAKLRAGVIGPSVDLDNFEAGVSEDDAGKPYMAIKAGRISGATLVAIPAFADQRLAVQDDDVPSIMASAWELEHFDAPDVFGVNSSSWQNLPIAPRNAEFSADIAIKRIAEWANGDTAKFSSAFLWKDPNRADNDMRAYRLPIGDIIDGKLTVVYHAIYAAAALIQGAHGGLPGVPDADKATLKGVINKMYAAMDKKFDEPLEPPWDQGADNKKALAMDDELGAEFAVKTSWSLPMASPDATWDASKALAALSTWAGDDMDKYGSAFLWQDPNGDPKQKGSYKLPIAMPIDGKLTIVPAAVRAVASVVAGGRGGVDIPDADKAKVKTVVQSLMSKIHGTDSQASIVAGGGPLAPPKMAFERPDLPADTPLPHITPDGRVFTYVAEWDTCHTGFADRCVVSPRSKTDYAKFHLGTVVTQEGDIIRVGKISLGGGHATQNAGLQAAVDHYDNVSTAVAIVRAGEDERGIYVAGALIPGVTDEQVAAFRRSPLSGDWRLDQSVDNLELVAALCVNVPGFPLAVVASGKQITLLASCVPGGIQASAEPVVEEAATEPVVPDDGQEERIGRLAAMIAADQVKRGERLKSFKE